MSGDMAYITFYLFEDYDSNSRFQNDRGIVNERPIF